MTNKINLKIMQTQQGAKINCYPSISNMRIYVNPTPTEFSDCIWASLTFSNKKTLCLFLNDLIYENQKEEPCLEELLELHEENQTDCTKKGKHGKLIHYGR